MAAAVQDWLTDLLGVQSVLQFGAQQPGYQHDAAALAEVDCTPYLARIPDAYSAVSLSVIRDNLAVVPEWTGGSVKSNWLNAESADIGLAGCTQKIKSADFIAFHEDFLPFIGSNAKLEMILEFEGEHANHVHEAPVYMPETNELVFADTSVVGWLWALDVETHKTRHILTSPPLHNVNGATRHKDRIYLTTNGSPTPAIHNCSLPISVPSPSSPIQETITCTTLVNNYRFAHLNSPNDLIFTSKGNILFTDPDYGWAQSWPGVGPPELPTSIYHFDTRARRLTALSNGEVLEPNGLVLSADERTLYVAESNSTSGRPIGVHGGSVRDVYGFEFEEIEGENGMRVRLGAKRLVHVVERGWPDGLRMTRLGGGRGEEVLLVAGMGGVDVVEVEGVGAGRLLGKFNVGDDVVFNLEAVKRGMDADGRRGVWLLTGRKGVYEVRIAGGD